MRLDKFLKVSRLIKRRTVANEACSAGRVLVNGKAAKAGTNVKPGDRIDIQFGNRETAVEVVNPPTASSIAITNVIIEIFFFMISPLVAFQFPLEVYYINRTVASLGYHL